MVAKTFKRRLRRPCLRKVGASRNKKRIYYIPQGAVTSKGHKGSWWECACHVSGQTDSSMVPQQTVSQSQRPGKACRVAGVSGMFQQHLASYERDKRDGKEWEERRTSSRPRWRGRGLSSAVKLADREVVWGVKEKGQSANELEAAQRSPKKARKKGRARKLTLGTNGEINGKGNTLLCPQQLVHQIPPVSASAPGGIL
ncbi:hypothetical protein K438DRAFT_1785680 [Mycena galopus ATCC 62051]|nr:hypothetical protein K438DRAFT_1785680 [Mycena galopus ATCC 62051]